MGLGQGIRDVPVIIRHITQTIVTHLYLCVEGALVIRHLGHFALHFLLLDVQLGLDSLSIHSLLVHVLEVVYLNSRSLHIVLTTQNHGQVLDNPLSIDHQELIAERVGLEVVD